MVCIYCGSETRVTNSRPQKRLNGVWRRRLCMRCNAVFSSIERVDYTKSISFKSQAALQPFSRDKLMLSLYDSLKHRPTAHEDASALCETVIRLLTEYVIDATIERDIVIETAAAVLERFDTAAGVYYRAYHPMSGR